MKKIWLIGGLFIGLVVADCAITMFGISEGYVDGNRFLMQATTESGLLVLVPMAALKVGFALLACWLCRVIATFNRKFALIMAAAVAFLVLVYGLAVADNLGVLYGS